MKFLEHYLDEEPVVAFGLEQSDLRYSLVQLTRELCERGAGPSPKALDEPWTWVSFTWERDAVIMHVTIYDLWKCYPPLRVGVIPRLIEALNDAPLPYGGQSPCLKYSSPGEIDWVEITFPLSAVYSKYVSTRSIRFYRLGVAMVTRVDDTGDTCNDEQNWEDAFDLLYLALETASAAVQEVEGLT